MKPFTGGKVEGTDVRAPFPSACGLLVLKFTDSGNKNEV